MNIKAYTDKTDLKNADYVTWRVAQGKRRLQEQLARREYNVRARLRRETRH